MNPFATTKKWLLAVAIGLVALTGVGLVAVYFYFDRQWHAAQADVRAGRYADAEPRLARCRMVWPTDPDVLLLSGRTARFMGQFDLAEGFLTACRKAQGESTEALQIEFLLLRAQTGEVDVVADDLFRFVARKHPETPMILETIARAFMHNLRYGPAYNCLNRWVDEQPDNAKPYNWRAWVLERMNNPGKAMADYRKALELDPSLIHVRLRIAEMYLEDKQPLDAAPHLETLLAEAPDMPQALARLGQCRFLQGQSAEARRLLEQAVEKLPTDAGVLLHLAKLDIQDRKYARAEDWLRKLLAVDPADSEARFTLVNALNLQRKTKEAAEALKEYERQKQLLERANHMLQAEAKTPSTDPAVAAEIGRILIEIRQERQGLFWLDEALRRNPNHLDAHKALAEYYERVGEADRAAAHRRRLAAAERPVGKT